VEEEEVGAKGAGGGEVQIKKGEGLVARERGVRKEDG